MSVEEGEMHHVNGGVTHHFQAIHVLKEGI